MKKLLYSISVALLALAGFSACSSETYDLGAGRVLGDNDLSWNVVEVDQNNYTFTNTSKEVEGVTYYITLDGRSSQVFPIGATESINLKKNGFYVVSIYAISRGDQQSLSWTKNVDWFVEVDDPQWLGFSGNNLLADAEAGNAHTWYANESWSEIPNTTLDGSLASGYTFTHTTNGGGQWQAQVQLEDIPVTLSSNKTYDFSIAIVSTGDSEGDGVTIKPQMQGDDNTFFSDARHPIHRGLNVITLTDQPGFDGNFKLAMDFAGLPEGTEVELKNIFVGEHNAENGGSTDTWAFDFLNDANLLKKDTDFSTKFWLAHEGWSAFVDNAESYEGFEGNAGAFTFVAPDGLGTTQWHGQAHIVFDGIQLSASKQYDFSLVLISDKDHPGVTVKPQKDGDDGTCFSDARHELKAGVPTSVAFAAQPGFDGTFQLCLDFAGAEAGATVRILGVYLGETPAE